MRRYLMSSKSVRCDKFAPSRLLFVTFVLAQYPALILDDVLNDVSSIRPHFQPQVTMFQTTQSERKVCTLLAEVLAPYLVLYI